MGHLDAKAFDETAARARIEEWVNVLHRATPGGMDKLRDCRETDDFWKVLRVLDRGAFKEGYDNSREARVHRIVNGELRGLPPRMNQLQLDHELHARLFMVVLEPGAGIPDPLSSWWHWAKFPVAVKVLAGEVFQTPWGQDPSPENPLSFESTHLVPYARVHTMYDRIFGALLVAISEE